MAQILLNMSEQLREKITAAAEARGLSRTKYILDLLENAAGFIPGGSITPIFNHTCLKCEHAWANKKERPSVCPACLSPRWDKKNALFNHFCHRCSHAWADKKEFPAVCQSCRSPYWNRNPAVKNQNQLGDDLQYYVRQCLLNLIPTPEIANRAGIGFSDLREYIRGIRVATAETVEAIRRVAAGEILAAATPPDPANRERRQTRNMYRNKLYAMGVSDEKTCSVAGEPTTWLGDPEAIVSQEQLDKLDEFYRQAATMDILAKCGKTMEAVAVEMDQPLEVILELAAGTRIPSHKGLEHLRINYPNQEGICS